jgi:hypothetical protein
MTGLNEILSGNPAPDNPSSAPEPSAPPAREPDPMPARREETVDLPRDRDPFPKPGEFPADTSAPPAPPAGEQEPEHVPYAALRDERRRRQDAERVQAEYERKLAAYEQMLQTQQASQAPQQPPPPDLFADPDGRLQHLERSLEQRSQELINRKILDMSATFERNARPDYAEAETAFVQSAKANPMLYEQMMADPHPAGFAYRVGKQILALREIGGDPAAYREKVRQEERDRYRKEWEEEQAGRQQQLRQSIPPSLARERDTSGRFAPAWSGPTPLSQIIAPRK